MRRLLDLLSPIPFPSSFMRVGGRLNAIALRRLGGRGFLASDALILTTRGRRTGKVRSTTLLYFDCDGRRFIVGSFAGADSFPAWYHNLVADPNVSIEIGGRRSDCLARVLEPDEAAVVWPTLDVSYSGFGRYRRRTSRPLPIVELLPAQHAPAG